MLVKNSILTLLIIISVQFSWAQKLNDDTVIVNENNIIWHITRKLAWKDFKGNPPSVSETNASASTNCGFDVSAQSDSNMNLIAVSIRNIFYGNKSWVRFDKRDMTKLLEHEQAHFDLCEVYARRLRKRVVDSNYQLNIDKAISEVFDAFKQRQKLYDKETNHSRNKEKQKEWLKIIADELQELNGYIN
jgi:hypothetical protein